MSDGVPENCVSQRCLIVSQKIGSVSDLLTSMKMMSLHLWPANTESLDELRLDVARRMLRSPHFNAKMNALKEVGLLHFHSFISHSEAHSGVRWMQKLRFCLQRIRDY